MIARSPKTEQSANSKQYNCHFRVYCQSIAIRLHVARKYWWRWRTYWCRTH